MTQPTQVHPQAYPPENDLQALFAEWVHHRALASSNVRAEKPLKRESALVYQEMWNAFAFFCSKHALDLQTLRTDDIAKFIASRVLDEAQAAANANPKRALTSRYIWRMLMLIDRITQFQAEKNGTEANPAARILLSAPEYRLANSAEQDGLIAYLRDHEAGKLYEYLNATRPEDALKKRNGWKILRDQTAVSVMLGAGLAPGDVRSLNMSGIPSHSLFNDGAAIFLALQGNGNAPGRETPIAKWAYERLAMWLSVRSKQRIPGSFVFPSTLSGKPWSHTGCYESCTKVLHDAGLAAQGGVFKLRHTFALRHLWKGVGESEVQRWLGIIDPTSMAQYRPLLKAIDFSHGCESAVKGRLQT